VTDAPIVPSFARSPALDLFLAVQRELSGRFAQEIVLLECPVPPEVAAFRDGVRSWKQAGATWLPQALAAVTDPRELADVVTGDLRPGARLVGAAMAAAADALAPALAEREHLRGEGEADVRALVGSAGVGGPLRAALGVPDRDLRLPLHLVPFAPHYPGAGFLGDGRRIVSAYADCRRFTGAMLADVVLTLYAWASLRSAPGPRNLLTEISTRILGAGRRDRRLRALVAKLLVELTTADLVRRVSPGHRAGVDVLGTAWRFPRLFGAAERHWRPYLAGHVSRGAALDALAAELSRAPAAWFVDDVDASAVAADFYLLEWLSHAGSDEARRVLAVWLPELAGYVCAHLDLVIGGELGHFERAEPAAAGPGHLDAFVRRVNAGDSRVAWYHTRMELGQSRALTLAAATFRGLGAEYGGDAWAPVAELLSRYVRHEISDTVFVDQCLTLEHNNGSLFDKYLATDRLREVLDAQAAGDLAGLAERASAEVRGIWGRHRAATLAGYSPRWLGEQVQVRPEPAGATLTRLPVAVPGLTGAEPGTVGCGSSLDAEDVAVAAHDGDGRSRVGRGGRRQARRRDAAPPRFRELAVILRTTLGDVGLELWPLAAPRTVENFVALAGPDGSWTDPLTGRPGRGAFYAGTPFHRRVPGFLVQGGDRTGTGRGGPGYRIPDELGPASRFDRPYLIGMVNTGAESAGSQFFVTLAAAPHLDGAYCAFGAVLPGPSRDVVDALARATVTPYLATVVVRAR
jgi:cyclophilin family peptidyl-prolyl cis-trans isomerase